MIRRILNLILLALMVVGAAVTYDMKHKAEMAADKVARLEADIAKEKDAIQLLRAEWALLRQPGRLQSVVDQYADYFKLKPFDPKQLATIDDIPLKQAPAPVPASSRESLARLAEGNP
jgi:hypothetical protein